MTDRYIIYVNDYTGYKILDIVYDIKDVESITNNLDINKYLSYIVIKHHIKDNFKEVINFGFLDYKVKRRKK